MQCLNHGKAAQNTRLKTYKFTTQSLARKLTTSRLVHIVSSLQPKGARRHQILEAVILTRRAEIRLLGGWG